MASKLVEWIKEHWDIVAISAIVIIAIVVVAWWAFSRSLPTPPY